jgi:hypothetical protein
MNPPASPERLAMAGRVQKEHKFMKDAIIFWKIRVLRGK